METRANYETAATLVQLSVGDYAPIRAGYEIEIAGIISEYCSTPGAKVSRFKNQFKRAIQESFYPAFEQGLIDGGGEAPAQGDDLDWINAKAEEEWGNVDMLFQQLKEAKTEDGFDAGAEASRRAASYAKTLDGVYNQGRLRGAKNKMLTFGGEDGQESCATCQKLKGQRHRASWWVKKGLTIFRGNANYECGCWNCQHYFYDDDGNLFTF